MQTKVCKKCQVEKPIVEFYKKLERRHPVCKDCERPLITEASRKYRNSLSQDKLLYFSARSMAFSRKNRSQMPSWADKDKITAVYLEAMKRRSDGEACEIDHVVPLVNPYVCGLHCEDNIRIVPRSENKAKSNRLVSVLGMVDPFVEQLMPRPLKHKQAFVRRRLEEIRESKELARDLW